jgi:transcriptional repressor of dcmA and dcmR
MERLLNVKEAAAFLHVSEMTIRRWTNAGTLACYRIGQKRERRFSPRELQKYLAGGTDAGAKIANGPGQVPLGLGGLAVPDGTHLTHLYFDAPEALEVQASFVRQGLDNGETVLVIAPDEGRENLWRTMSQGGLDVPAFMSRNSLHQAGGRESSADLSAYISQVAASARGRFRLLGDMIWAKRKRWPLERLRSLEEKTNARLSPNTLFLCQYSLAEFSGQETLMACEEHQYAIYKGRLQESLLF